MLLNDRQFSKESFTNRKLRQECPIANIYILDTLTGLKVASDVKLDRTVGVHKYLMYCFVKL